MTQLHVSTSRLLAVIRSTPLVSTEAKEYVIERLRRNNELGVLRNSTVHSFVLGMAMGALYGDPKIKREALQCIINQVRDLTKLPFVEQAKD